MTLEQIGILLSITGSVLSIAGTTGMGIYAFAVLRTQVNQQEKILDALVLRTAQHIADDDKHHNARAAREFEARIDQKFESLEKEIGEVKRYCEEIDSKLDDRQRSTQ